MKNRMIKKALITCAMLMAPSVAAMDCKVRTAEDQPRQITVDELKKVGERYTAFLTQFGLLDGEKTILPVMGQLFTRDCKKIVNGETICITLQGIFEQISMTKQKIGTWRLKVLKSYHINVEARSVAVHYEIPTDNDGTIVVMKYLTCDDKGLIKEIDEVFNKKLK